MGISLDRKLSIAGYRPAVFKSALRGFLRTRSPAALVDLRSVFSLRRDGAIVFEECLDRGLIHAETLEVTKEGKSLARSKVTSRTPLSKARAVLDEFLARIEALNGDPEALRQIDQVWLFGSLMRRQADVGDIDLAVTSSRAAGFEKDHPKRERHVDELLSRIHDAPAHWAYA